MRGRVGRERGLQAAGELAQRAEAARAPARALAVAVRYAGVRQRVARRTGLGTLCLCYVGRRKGVYFRPCSTMSGATQF